MFKKGDLAEISRAGERSLHRITGDEKKYDENISYVKITDANNYERETKTHSLKKLETVEQQMESAEQIRQQGILQIALKLKEVEDRAAWALAQITGEESDAEQTNTGLFVVVGVYSGNGPHKPYISAVKATPGTTGKEISLNLKEAYPDGMPSIPKNSTELPGTSYGQLVAYWAYELSEQAAALIDWEVQEV